MKVLFPSTFLAPYVEAYYISSDLRQDSPGAHFPAISTSYIKFSSGSAVVSGQATKPTVAVVNLGNETGLGVKLRPGAFPALFGLPAHELTDRVTPLEEILGKTANDLNEQITGAPNSSAQVGRFERTFVRFAQRHRENSHLIERQAATILRQLSTMQVSNLAERLGYSSRHFQRKINDYVGLSPRLYKRIVRFEKALELIQRSARRGNMDWSALAVICGYTDQAHFIRDFRQFAGQTPVAYLVSLQGN
ncbi:MAG: AraC family transcriptional regulator [Chloroflexi bacterium]|nr:MAG: AraC family transcriptional regulator [Chloroflexota bacterium]